MDDAETVDVAAFVAACVETYAELQVLLTLREHSERTWSVVDLADVLRVRPLLLEPACAALRDAGLLRERSGSDGRRFAYSPRSRKLDVSAAALARAFATNWSAVVKTINDNAIERVRTAAIRAFAEAFVIRRVKRS